VSTLKNSNEIFSKNNHIKSFFFIFFQTFAI
jgi:hypothetical protein